MTVLYHQNADHLGLADVHVLSMMKRISAGDEVGTKVWIWDSAGRVYTNLPNCSGPQNPSLSGDHVQQKEPHFRRCARCRPVIRRSRHMHCSQKKVFASRARGRQALSLPRNRSTWAPFVAHEPIVSFPLQSSRQLHEATGIYTYRCMPRGLLQTRKFDTNQWQSQIAIPLTLVFIAFI